MSIYRSEAVLTNITDTSIQVGTILIFAHSSVVFWNTQDSGISAKIFDTFAQLRSHQDTLNTFVSAGSLIVVQDGIQMSYTQYLICFGMMCDAVDKATDLSQLLIPTRSVPKQPDGTPLVALAPRQGTAWVVGTHNFADATSWFGDSQRVVDEELADSGDGFLFLSKQTLWVDMISGRVHNQALWVQIQKGENPTDPHGYQPIVKSNGVTLTMREPFEPAGGDYEILWELGKVQFFNSQAGNTITASYSYPTTSAFHIRPKTPGTSVVVEDAEIDISTDLVLTDEIVYSWWYFYPPLSQWFCLGEYAYQRASQIVTEARGNYPQCETFGTTEAERAIPLPEFRRMSRGMKSARQSLPFNYTTTRTLPMGTELRIYLRHHRPFGGEHATMTIYCTELSDGSVA